MIPFDPTETRLDGLHRAALALVNGGIEHEAEIEIWLPREAYFELLGEIKQRGFQPKTSPLWFVFNGMGGVKITVCCG